MGQINPHRRVLLLLGIISGQTHALDWSERMSIERWGPIALRSPDFDFNFTTYYEKEMGPGLRKRFVVFEKLIDPAELVSAKRLTNDWEVAYAEEAEASVSRPLNLDPGYLTEAKLVLATTKDRDHRLYLDQGIFAEVTLYFHRGQWQSRPWTYPDYQSAEYQAFFHQCREYLRERYREP